MVPAAAQRARQRTRILEEQAAKVQARVAEIMAEVRQPSGRAPVCSESQARSALGVCPPSLLSDGVHQTYSVFCQLPSSITDGAKIIF